MPAKLGVFEQKGVNNYYDKSIIHLPRQHTGITPESLVNQGEIEVGSSDLDQV